MRFYVLTTRLELSKPWRFFPETPFGGIRQDGLMRGENFSGQKNNFFLSRMSQREIQSTFFSAMARNLHILARNWYNLARNCTFWQEIVHFGKKLYILARNCTFWQEFVVFGKTKLALARKKLTIFLASTWHRHRNRRTAWLGG